VGAVTSFEAFWAICPRRVAKQAALRAWSKLSESDRALAMAGITRQRAGLIARGVEYIPHPATWLNGKRWADEVEVTVTNSRYLTAADTRSRLEFSRPVSPDRARAGLAEIIQNLKARGV